MASDGLRPYQQACLDQLRAAYQAGSRSPLLVAPTGAGKTVMFSAVCKGAVERGNSVLILAHRIELIDQISQALDRQSVRHGYIAAGYPKHSGQPVVVSSVQTLVRRLDVYSPPGLIITDEAHHSCAGSYLKVYAAYPSARKLGVTATPTRMSGEGLRGVYDHLILGPDVSDLISAGYLSRYRIFAPPTVDTAGLHVRGGEYVQSEVAERMEKPAVYGSAISHYRQHADGKRAVCFCYSVEHSRSMAKEFRDAGLSAASLEGSTPREIRRQMLADFRDGKLLILCSVDVVGEGLDVPAIECGMLLRPTASLTVHLQQIGRCLRPFPGKPYAVILDHVGNTLRHGLPDDEREWTLDGRDRKARKTADRPASVRVCPMCWSASRPGPLRCPHCGHVFEIKSREVEEKAGELREITPEMLTAKRRRIEVGRSQSLDDLIAIEKSRGYKTGWAMHVWQAKQRKHGATSPRSDHDDTHRTAQLNLPAQLI